MGDTLGAARDRILRFEELRLARDEDLHRSFRNKFEKMVMKYETLCRNGVVYKKMSKMSFIEKTNNAMSVLSTLNKLTVSNADALADKIVFKCSAANVVDIISQVITYGSNADVNHRVLVSIVERLSERHADMKERMQPIFEEYYRAFKGKFDTSRAKSDNYEGFLDQNVHASRVKGTLRMLIELGCSESCARIMSFTLHDVCVFLIDQLDATFLLSDDTWKCLITDCIYILVSAKRARDRIRAAVDLFLGHDFQSRFSITSNRHRFKMYDIYDVVDKWRAGSRAVPQTVM